MINVFMPLKFLRTFHTLLVRLEVCFNVRVMDAKLQAAVGNRYQLERLLGKGGMGSVYLARDVALHRYVAIKTLAHHALSNAGLARFRAEAEVTARLQHPHIVQVYEVAESTVPFLVLEPLKGESLRSRLQREPVFSIQRACLIAVQVLSALAAAHKAGVVHRDIKPPNIFLVETPAPGVLAKVLDFGVARLSTHNPRITRAGELVGTIAYMSPEQAEGQEVDGRSDVYSLAVVLYEMLAGKRPFEGTSPEHLRALMLSAAPSPIPQCPEALNTVLLTALSRHPNERFRSAHAMADALAPFLPRVTHLHPPVTAQTQEPTATAPTPARNLAPVWILLGLMAVAAVTATGIGLYTWKNQSVSVPEASVKEGPQRTGENVDHTDKREAPPMPSLAPASARSNGAGPGKSPAPPMPAPSKTLPSGVPVSSGTCLCIPPRTAPQGNTSLVPNYTGRACVCSAHGSRLCAARMSCDAGRCAVATSCVAKGVVMNAPFEGACSGWDDRGVHMNGKWECDHLGEVRAYPGPSNTPCRGYQADGVLRDGVTDCR